MAMSLSLFHNGSFVCNSCVPLSIACFLKPRLHCFCVMKIRSVTVSTTSQYFKNVHVWHALGRISPDSLLSLSSMPSDYGKLRIAGLIFASLLFMGASVFFCVSSTTMSTCLLHVVGDTSLYVYSPQLISTY